ncbi:type V toxin-antitoxin system endoribonuclease antitoxin GhoS [Escherichia coli]
MKTITYLSDIGCLEIQGASLYDMNFSSIVADEYGIPRQLNENSFAITTSLAASEIEDLIRLKCLDLPDIDFDLNIMTVDDYFRQFYK